jgi:hypothetical protein
MMHLRQEPLVGKLFLEQEDCLELKLFLDLRDQL